MDGLAKGCGYTVLTIIGAALLIYLLSAVCISGNRSASESNDYIVQYKVAGSCRRVSLTYSNEDGGTSQQDAQVPWSHKYYAKRGHFAYISAQNLTTQGGVKVEIYVDNYLQKQSESFGPYKIASASMRLNRYSYSPN